MSEMWAALRDSVGERSTVVYEHEQTTIKDLPEGRYTIKYNGKSITKEPICPNQIPGTLMNYCENLEKQGVRLEGRVVSEIITGMNIVAKKVN